MHFNFCRDVGWSWRLVYGVQDLFEIIHAFETRKKFMKSFSEIKNKKCLSYRNVADDALFLKRFYFQHIGVQVSEAFYRYGLF